MKTRDIHQQLVFPTTAIDLYKCLMDPRIHSSFTGAEAVVEDKEGSTFTTYDGYIKGRNITLERGKKIVQTWQAQEENWPEMHYSEVTFIFTPTANGCTLDMYHSGVPEELADNIEKGWPEYYWEPLMIYLER